MEGGEKRKEKEKKTERKEKREKQARKLRRGPRKFMQRVFITFGLMRSFKVAECERRVAKAANESGEE